MEAKSQAVRENRVGVLYEDAANDDDAPNLATERRPSSSVAIFPVNAPPSRRKRQMAPADVSHPLKVATASAASKRLASSAASSASAAAASVAAAAASSSSTAAPPPPNADGSGTTAAAAAAASSSNGGVLGMATNPLSIELPAKPMDDHEFLDSRQVADADELYGENERALSNFIKLHPMLSLDATSEKILNKVSEMIDDFSIACKDVEVVTKWHDDLFLRPANAENGERPCVNGEKCVCRWTAIFRHGENSERAFVCREYVLPSHQKVFESTGELPRTVGKCLLCCRYFNHYIYTLARNSPKFCPKTPIQLQAFCNKITVPRPIDDAPSHSSSIGTDDGYRESVMLFVDEKWADVASSRNEMAALMWRPTVRFNSSDYQFVVDSEGVPRAIQINMAVSSQNFGLPAC